MALACPLRTAASRLLAAPVQLGNERTHPFGIRAKFGCVSVDRSAKNRHGHSPLRSEGALMEPGTQCRAPAHCKSFRFRNLRVMSDVLLRVSTSSESSGGHPEEASREESEIVVDSCGGVAVKRRRGFGTRHE